MTDFGYRVVEVAEGRCQVGPAVLSQWRNGSHWHTVWPDAGSWCFKTEEEAKERHAELIALAEFGCQCHGGPHGGYTCNRCTA